MEKQAQSGKKISYENHKDGIMSEKTLFLDNNIYGREVCQQ